MKSIEGRVWGSVLVNANDSIRKGIEPGVPDTVRDRIEDDLCDLIEGGIGDNIWISIRANTKGPR